MQTNLPTYHFDAVVLPDRGQNDDNLPYGALRVELHTAGCVYPALTWIPPYALTRGDDRVVLGHVHACDLNADADNRLLVLTRIDASGEANPLAHVSSAACPLPGEVDAVRRLVSTIDHPALHDFVADAYREQHAFRWFWTCPASLSHHHAHAGGLASHSRQVAENAAAAVGDVRVQRDYAIAYGLLHDYGKLWSYEEGHLTPMASRLGHEQIGYEKLLPALLRMRKVWPDGGVVMQSLLSGQWKRDGNAPILAVGNVVRSLDQFSAETDLSERPCNNARWRPTIVRVHPNATGSSPRS